MTAIRKDYVDTPGGQIHRRRLESVGDVRHPALVCLHPAPYSGAYFTTVMPMLNDGRALIAPDYPGYGGSYPPTEPPSIGDYAAATLAAIDDDRVDLLGFHSGCLVAAEMAILAPERVRQLVLIDIPFFGPETQQKFYGQVAKPLDLCRDLDSLRKAWDFNVASREGIVPLARAFDMFVDQISTGQRDYFCFHAAFTYDCLDRFARIADPCTVIATQSPLLEPTRAAAKAIAQARLVEEPAITTSVFEQGADTIAGHIRSVLDDA